MRRIVMRFISFCYVSECKVTKKVKSEEFHLTERKKFDIITTPG